MNKVSQNKIRKAFPKMNGKVRMLISLLSIGYMVFMPLQIFSQNRIECSSPGNCDGWLYHKNKIGIGTGWSEAYIPRTTLHLHEFESTNTFLNITNHTTGFPTGSQTLGLFLGMMGNQAIISNFQNNNLSLFTGNTERFTLTPDGKIGIGITTPVTMFDVNGQVTIRGGNPANNNILVSDAIGTASWQPLQAGAGININGITISNTSPDIPVTLIGGGATIVSGTYPNFTISSTDNNTTYNAGTGITLSGTTINSVWTKNGNYIYNNNTSNVGIGLSTPQNLLHVHKSSGVTTVSEEKAGITPGGGTHLEDITTIWGIQITNTSTGTTANDGIKLGINLSGKSQLMSFENGSFAIGTNNTELITLTPQGNVGIGTTAPSAKLHAKGTLRFESLATATNFQNQKVLITDATGNVSQIPANLIGDNLGNHTASQNIKMNDKWISNDGNDKGIKISNNGDVYVSGNLGVGTLAPQVKIHAYDNSNNSVVMRAENNAGNIRIGVDGVHGIINSSQDLMINYGTNKNVTVGGEQSGNFATLHNTYLAVTDGNVGVGVTVAYAKLHTKGTLRFENLTDATNIQDQKVLIVDATGNVSQALKEMVGDNLGSHVATKNITMSDNWISYDGTGSGIQIKDNGNVQVGSGITQVNIGKSYSNDPYYLSSYVGFNAQRNNHGQWLFASDDVNNGGSALINDVAGNLRIVTYRPTQGTTTATLSESELMANTQLLITSNKKIGLRTTNINADADVQIKGTTYVEDKMGIGICLGANNNPKGYRFAVNGTMGAKDVYIEVDETPWPDYVFEPEHRLMPLSDLEWYINKNKHLPDIPSANDIKENGLSLAEINAQLVKKVEELTLYIIELNKKMDKYENK